MKIIIFVLLLFSLGTSQSVHAMDKDVRTVFKASGYGLVGGALVGVATLPITQDIRAVFLGGSIGLYLGIAVGIIYVYNREGFKSPEELAKGALAPTEGQAHSLNYPIQYPGFNPSVSLLPYYFEASQGREVSFTIVRF